MIRLEKLSQKLSFPRKRESRLQFLNMDSRQSRLVAIELGRHEPFRDAESSNQFIFGVTVTTVTPKHRMDILDSTKKKILE